MLGRMVETAICFAVQSLPGAQGSHGAQGSQASLASASAPPPPAGGGGSQGAQGGLGGLWWHSRRVLSKLPHAAKDPETKRVVLGRAKRIALQHHSSSQWRERQVACLLLRDLALSCGSCPLPGAGARWEVGAAGTGASSAASRAYHHKQGRAAELAEVREEAAEALCIMLSDVLAPIRHTATLCLASLLRDNDPRDQVRRHHTLARKIMRNAASRCHAEEGEEEEGDALVLELTAHVLAHPAAIPLSLRRVLHLVRPMLVSHRDAVVAQALWQVEDVIREIADYSDTHLAVPLLGCQADMLQCDSSDFDPRCPGLCTDLSYIG